MTMTTQPLKFTTRELRITREMTPEEFVKSVRGAMTDIANELGVSVQAVSAVLHRKTTSARISKAVARWIRRELRKKEAA